MSKAKTLFVIDDDSDDRELFAEALYEVDSTIKCVSAQGGEEALRHLKKPGTEYPYLIFLDLNMPRINGKQCLIEIKKIKELVHIPVIIYSTSSAQKDIDETYRLGASYFFTKPTSFTELCKQLNKILTKNWSDKNSQNFY